MNEKCKYIHPLASENLSEILLHADKGLINRLIPKDFPVHLAIHSVDCFDLQSKKYVDLHYHEHPEINIILPLNGSLTYKVQIGEEIHVIKNPSAIWIPAKTKHAANLIYGKGFFICIILANEYRAQS